MAVVKETERITRHDRLAQGDILKIEHPTSKGSAPALGIVINADCDLANGKTDGVVAYLPLYTFRQYLELFWAERFVQELSDQAVKRIQELIGLKSEHTDDLVRWIKSETSEKISASLIKKHDLKRGPATQLQDHLNRLAICANASNAPFERVKALCQLEKDPSASARKHLNTAKKSMGDGHFFISDIVDHEDVGFVVRMRRIYSIDAEHCYLNAADQKSRSDGTQLTAFRFATLTALYKFKVAQLFALQFSRVGLPDENTALSELAIDDLASQLSKVAA